MSRDKINTIMEIFDRNIGIPINARHMPKDGQNKLLFLKRLCMLHLH